MLSCPSELSVLSAGHLLLIGQLNGKAVQSQAIGPLSLGSGSLHWLNLKTCYLSILLVCFRPVVRW